MDTNELNLKRFCSIKGIDIIRERDVQFGKQFTLKSLGDTVHLIIFSKTKLVQGKESKLKEIINAWADKSDAEPDGGYYDLPAGWREWNENSNWIKEYHKKYGVPKEEQLKHKYIINREILFHDYMFRNGPTQDLDFSRFEKLVRAWFYRNCFMNLNTEAIVSSMKREVENSGYSSITLDEISFSYAAELLAKQFSRNCPTKFACIGKNCKCPQTDADYSDCLLDIVDALYPYFSNQVLSYTKGNLNKLIEYDYDLKWKDISPSTPIEEIMSNKLIDAGILSLPQYQAWDETHRYNIDFVVKTPQGMNIAVECDGLQFHAKPSAYIHDRKRDRYLQDKGFYVMRFSSVEIYNEIKNVISEIDKSYWKIQKKQLDIRKPYRISYFGYGEEE